MAKKSKEQTPLSIELPLGGLDVSQAVGAQPPGTSPDLLNVRIRNSVNRRITIGQRDGVSAHSDRALGTGKIIQAIQTVGVATTYAPVATPVDTLMALDNSAWRWYDKTTGAVDYSFGTVDLYGHDASSGGNLILEQVNTNTIRSITTAGATAWSFTFDSGADQGISAINSQPDTDLVVVTSKNPSTTWDETNGDSANVWILEASTGVCIWHGLFKVDSSTQHVIPYLDDQGNLYLAGRWSAIYQWPGGEDYSSDDSEMANILSFKPDLSDGARGRSNTAGSLNWKWIFQYDSGYYSSSDRVLTLDFRAADTGYRYVATYIDMQDAAQTGTYGSTVVINADTGSLLHMLHTGDESYQYNGGQPNVLPTGDIAYLTARPVGTETHAVSVMDINSGVSTKVFTYSTSASKTSDITALSVDEDGNIYIAGYDTDTYDGATPTENKAFIRVNATTYAADWAVANPGGGAAISYMKYRQGKQTIAKISDRDVRLYAITENDLYFFDDEVPVLKQSDISTGPQLYPIRTIALQQKLYIIDSAGQGSAYYYDPVTDTKTEWTAAVTDGTMPTDGRLMCAYRGRAVISSGEQWYMSAVGDPLNWDYNPTTFLETQAIAGTVAKYQQVSDFHKCIAPYSDDMMVIGCDHEIWAVRGDPAAGGSIDNITYTLGVTGADSWAFSDDGTFFFFGQGQVFSMTPDGQISPVSSPRLDRLLEAIDLYTHHCRMEWDRRNQTIHVFFSPAALPATAPYHYVWHKPSGSWWKDQYTAVMGPTCVSIFDGDNPDDRMLLLGGYNGYVYKIDPTATDDDGTQISSYIALGVYQPIGVSHNAIMTRMNAIMPPSSEDLNVKVYAGDTPNEALSATTPIFTQNISSGRIPPMLQRVAGNSFKFVLECAEESASDDWAMEQMDIIFEPGGMARYGRI